MQQTQSYVSYSKEITDEAGHLPFLSQNETPTQASHKTSVTFLSPPLGQQDKQKINNLVMYMYPSRSLSPCDTKIN